MSQTYSLVAMESKVSLWIGQTTQDGARLYNSIEHNKRLFKFLNAYAGEKIELVNDNLMGEFPEYTNISNFKGK